MRAGVVRQLPALSYHFHLSPADVWDMPGDELAAYMDALQALASQREGTG